MLYGEEKDGEDYHLDDNNTKVYVDTYKYFQYNDEKKIRKLLYLLIRKL